MIGKNMQENKKPKYPIAAMITRNRFEELFGHYDSETKDRLWDYLVSNYLEIYGRKH